MLTLRLHWQVTLGVPYAGRHGRMHPLFDFVLFGSLKTKRIRSFRFKVTLMMCRDELSMK